MIIHEYPYNMSCERLELHKPYVIKKNESFGTVRRISLYPWPGGYDVDIGLARAGSYRFKPNVK
jgi:hypothetical protein